MRRKHPPSTSSIPPITPEQLSHGRFAIDHEEMVKTIRGLDSDTGPGIGGLRNEHLLALARPRTKFTIPAAAAAVESFSLLGSDVVTGRLPPWWYNTYIATRLVPGNKDKPTGDPNEVPDCRPINVGGASRRALATTLGRTANSSTSMATISLLPGCPELAFAYSTTTLCI
jgi:hypothetical protein